MAWSSRSNLIRFYSFTPSKTNGVVLAASSLSRLITGDDKGHRGNSSDIAESREDF